PTLIEPNFRLVAQGRAWAIGYIVVLALTAFCAGVTRKYLPVCVSEDKGNEKSEARACVADDSRLTYKERGWWVLLAFVPSSMMLGVTTFLSTDVAAIPLFWVIPLSLYLLSFIIVFARVPARVHRIMILLLPISIAALVFANFSDIGIPKWVIFIFHLVNFLFYCMVCHGEIARTRPATKHLTEFYLWISIGGVLGGIFNSLIAPVIFNTVLEYPMILVLGAMLLPVRNRNGLRPLTNWRNILLYLGVPLVLVLLTYWSTAKWHAGSINLSWLSDPMNVKPETLYLTIAYGFLVLFCYGLVFLKKPFLFGIGIASVLLTVVVSKDIKQNVVHRERSFFGVLTVTRDVNGRFMNLSHGTTLHGMQRLNPINRLEPVAYYHPKGPAGQVFSEFKGRKKKSRIAVTGLGTGSLAAYAGPGQEIDFYEIDQTVKKISTNPAYFSFLSECKARWKVILGDARLTMEKAPPHSYGIIILDAFSSDAIPVHLLTKEAVNLYFSKLRKDGVLLIHISNKYVNLAPVLAKLADESGLAGRLCDDEEDDEIGKYGTTWVLLARKETDFGGLSRSNAWKKIESRETVNVWTDDFSNILSVFKW
ncbi:MAG: fused MFS/spermidine synthase, partial [Syntrophales bacterium]|nr:fused MFS/spermidine synthase [Syntrophales bacterium]